MIAPTSAAADMPASGIREVLSLALASSRPVERLEIGDPDFATPAHIVEAAYASARSGSSYVQSAGTPQLRSALQGRLERVGAHAPGPAQIIVTPGAVQACAALIAAIAGPGDEVLIPDPAWPNYAMQVALVGAEPVGYRLSAERGYAPDVAEMATLITPRTRAIVINSPHNPTGAVMSQQDVHAIVELAERHDLLVISDEVYDEILFEGAAAHAQTVAPHRVAAVYSFSKTYAMTGWRVGYAVVPAWLATPLERILEATLSCVSTVTQAAALAALEGPQDVVAHMRESYRERRDLALGVLADVRVVAPQGAFYLLVPLAAGVDSRGAAADLVREGVALAPGTAFGARETNFLRLSLSSSAASIERGLGVYLDWYRATSGGLTVV